MAGNILKMARRDSRNIVTAGGFEEDILFCSKDQSLFFWTKGLHSKHWKSFDTDGSIINSKNVHLNIPEDLLVGGGFETRSKRTGNVKLRGCVVVAKDATGIFKNYVVNEVFPSETFGLIVFILGDASDLVLSDDINQSIEDFKLANDVNE